MARFVRVLPTAASEAAGGLTTGGGEAAETVAEGGGAASLAEGVCTVSAAAALAAETLLAGGLVALATDTIYGVAALAQNSHAVSAIYRLKQRDAHKPLAVCVADAAEVQRWAQVEPGLGPVISALLPGPVTLLLPRSPLLNPLLNPDEGLVGIRVPQKELVCEVARLCAVSGPLALTSANTSGASSCLRVDEFDDLWPRLDLVVDEGPICGWQGDRGGSTVVDLSQPPHYRIVRDGCALTNTRKILQNHGWHQEQ